MDFGKKITTESYAHGKVKKTTVAYVKPELVKDKSDLLSEIISGLNLITDKKTKCLRFTIETDSKYQLKLVTREYEVEA